MIRQLIVLALGAVSLSGCWGETAPPPPPGPTPRPVIVDPPVEWITADPVCRGSLRRGEWLVCDNTNLRYLHRTLATEWAAKRQGADRRVLRVMLRQQQALLSERSLCEDAACVATAYLRYLSGYGQPEPRPTWTPKQRKPIKKPPPRRHHHDDWGSGGSGSSCAAEVGGSASAYLVRQCRVVNGSWARGCTAQRSCDDLREMINQGCSSGGSRPGFCNRR